MLVAVEVEPGLAVGVPDPALAHPALVGAVEVALRVGVDLEDGPVAIDPGAVDLCQGGGGEVVLAQLFGGVAGRLLVRFGVTGSSAVSSVPPQAARLTQSPAASKREKSRFCFMAINLLFLSLPGNGGKPN